jgi:hypothetical protein
VTDEGHTGLPPLIDLQAATATPIHARLPQDDIHGKLVLPQALAFAWAVRAFAAQRRPRVRFLLEGSVTVLDQGRWLSHHVTGSTQQPEIEIRGLASQEVTGYSTSASAVLATIPPPRRRRSDTYAELNAGKAPDILVLQEHALSLFHEEEVRSAITSALAQNLPVVFCGSLQTALLSQALFEELGATTTLYEPVTGVERFCNRAGIIRIQALPEAADWQRMDTMLMAIATAIKTWSEAFTPLEAWQTDLQEIQGAWNLAESHIVMADGRVVSRIGGLERSNLALPPPPPVSDLPALGRWLLAVLDARERLVAEGSRVEISMFGQMHTFDLALSETTGLFGYVRRGNSLAIARYLRRGFPVDPVDAQGRTPLQYAVILGHLRIAERLIDAGANVNHRDQHGRAVIDYCVATENPEAFLILIEAGGDPGQFAPLWSDTLGIAQPEGASTGAPQPPPADQQPPPAPALPLSRAIYRSFHGDTPATADAEHRLPEPAALDIHLRTASVPADPSAPGDAHPTADPQGAAAGAKPATAEQPPRTPPLEIAETPATSAADAAEPPVAPTAAAAFPKPTLVPVMAWVAQLTDPDAKREAPRRVAAWLREKKLVMDPHDLNLDTPEATVTSDASADGALWTLRYDDLRTAGLIFRTEIVVAALTDARVMASVRLLVIAQAGVEPAVHPSVPGVVKRLASLGATDAGLPLGQPLGAATDDAAGILADALLDPHRNQPVLVVADGAIDRLPDLAAACCIVDLRRQAMRQLADRIGAHHTPAPGTWRLYPPGFNPDRTERHELLTITAPASSAKGALTARLALGISVMTRDRSIDAEVIPTYLQVRGMIAARNATAAPADSDALAVRLREERDTWRSMAEEAERSAAQATARLEEELATLREKLHNERVRNKNLAYTLAQLREREEREITIPDSFDALEAFAAEHLGDDVVLTSKALRTARAAVSDPATVRQAYEALLLLATVYLPMRMGDEEARAAFEARCAELKIRVGPVGLAAETHRYKDEYRVMHERKTWTTDLHVAGSDSRDRRLILRIYFAYDEQQGRVIVGSLPDHATNTLT